MDECYLAEADRGQEERHKGGQETEHLDPPPEQTSLKVSILDQDDLDDEAGGADHECEHGHYVGGGRGGEQLCPGHHHDQPQPQADHHGHPRPHGHPGGHDVDTEEQ